MKFKHRNEYWLRSGFFTILKNLSGLVLGLAGFFFLVRVLDKTDFGVWALFLSTVTLLELVRSGLVCNGLIKYLASANEREYPKIISASASLMAVLTGIIVVLILGLAPYLSRLWHMPELVTMFYLYIPIFICTGAMNLLNSVQQAGLKFSGTFFSSLVGPVLNLIYILLCYAELLPVNLIALVLVQLGGVSLSLGISISNTRRLLTFSPGVDKAWMRTLFGYGKFSFGTMVSAVVFSSIDGWMLGALIAPAAAGAYSIAIRITNLVEVPTSTVATIVFPQSAKRMESGGKDAVKYLYEKSVGTILALLLPSLLALYLFSGYAVHLLAGEQYAESVAILKVTLLYALLIPYGRQFGTIMDSIGKPDVNFKLVVLAAALNVALNYFFIQQYGILGAAYGTLSANAVTFVIAQVILKKQLGVRLFNTLLYAVRFYPEMFNKYVRRPAAPKILTTPAEL